MIHRVSYTLHESQMNFFQKYTHVPLELNGLSEKYTVYITLELIELSQKYTHVTL